MNNVRAILLSCVLIMLLGALSPLTAYAQDFTPYLGEVDGTDVYVRSNAMMSAYPCTKLSRPARVTVVGSAPEWLKILPPEGTFSVISKEYVSLSSDGKTGMVTGDNVWVRAGGTLRDNDFWAIQTQMNTGATVNILGDLGDYYKITPPENAFFWISDRFVKRVGEVAVSPAAPAAVAAPSDGDQAPPAETTYEYETVLPLPTAQPAPSPATQTVDSSEKKMEDAHAEFRRVESDLRKEYAKPADQRDYDGLIERFRAIDVPEGSPLGPYVDYWVLYLENSKQQRKLGQQFESLVTESEDRQKEFELNRLKEEVAPETQKPPFTVKGVVEPSAIYLGAAGRPRWYLLRSPDSGKIESYLESTGNLVNLAAYTGQYVSVLGNSRYDRDTQTLVVDVENITVLSKNVSLPAPPKPTVGPMPASTLQQSALPKPTIQAGAETPVEPPLENPLAVSKETPSPEVAALPEKKTTSPVTEPLSSPPEMTESVKVEGAGEKQEITERPPINIESMEEKKNDEENELIAPADLLDAKPTPQQEPLAPEITPIPSVEEPVQPEPTTTPAPEPLPALKPLPRLVPPTPLPAPAAIEEVEEEESPAPEPELIPAPVETPVVEETPAPEVTPETKPAEDVLEPMSIKPLEPLKIESIPSLDLETETIVPEAKPESPAVVEPTLPTVEKMDAVAPAAPAPIKPLEPLAAPVPLEPLEEVRPEATTQPAPASAPVILSKPLPPMDLPMIKPTSQPDGPYVEEEYD